MKLIIAGSRSIKNYDVVRQAVIESGLWKLHKKKLIIISGMAPGVDRLGEEFAERNGLKCLKRPAAWDDIKAKGAVVKMNPTTGHLYNAVAGHWRNQEMADEADALLLVWDGQSTGSEDMHERATKKGLDIYAYSYQFGRLTRF